MTITNAPTAINMVLMGSLPTSRAAMGAATIPPRIMPATSNKGILFKRMKNVMALEPFIGGGSFVSIRDRKYSEVLAITYIDEAGRLALPAEAQNVLAEELAAEADAEDS